MIANRKKVRLFFGRLHRQLHEEWERKIRIIRCVPMEEDVEEATLQQRIRGSENDIYYVAGWLLFKLSSCSLRGLDDHYMSEFVTFNSLSAHESPLLP